MKNKIRLWGIIALWLLSCGNAAFAAGPELLAEKVTGTVLDEAGVPVIGASVIQKGTSNGTVTDVDGNFTLDVPSDATLEVSFIGYVTQDVAINGKSVVSITISEDAEQLDEVVVVGYGTMKKRDVTGSISQAKGLDITMSQPFSALDGLRGRHRE